VRAAYIEGAKIIRRMSDNVKMGLLIGGIVVMSILLAAALANLF
jgi:hypothetical protein